MLCLIRISAGAPPDKRPHSAANLSLLLVPALGDPTGGLHATAFRQYMEDAEFPPVRGKDERPRQRACNCDARGRRAGAARRPLRADDLLSARLRHRPMRFPLRLLHVGTYAIPAATRSADARGARPAVLRLCRARHQEAAHHRRRAAGAPRRDEAVCALVAPPRLGGAGGADAHHQWLAACPFRRRTRRLRRAAGQCLARYARPRSFQGADPHRRASRRFWRGSPPRARPASR